MEGVQKALAEAQDKGDGAAGDAGDAVRQRWDTVQRDRDEPLRHRRQGLPQGQGLPLHGILAHVHLGELEEPVHHGLHVRLLGPDGPEIPLLGRLVLGDALQQRLRIGPDGGQGAFQVVGHPSDELLLPLLLGLPLLQGRLQPGSHLVHGVAGRLELVRLPVGDGGVQVAVPDAGDARRQGLQGLRDVAEEVPGQVVVGPGDGQQQHHDHRPGVDAEDGGGVREQALDLLPRLVQLPQGDPQLGQVHPLQ